jgi:hypothetical protein
MGIIQTLSIQQVYRHTIKVSSTAGHNIISKTPERIFVFLSLYANTNLPKYVNFYRSKELNILPV